jgi:flagellar basal-body rod protein FlgB
MPKHIYSEGNLDVIKRSLDAYALRQRVIAENVAHLETPGYRARSVSFERELSDAMSRGGETLPEPRVLDRSPLSADNGVNDVDLEQEMAALAETNLRHKLATRILSIRYQLLRSAIRGRG